MTLSSLDGERPIHTRNFDVAVRAATPDSEGSPGHWDARGELVDLRKGGFVPIAADLQTGGLLHHMQVRAGVDPRADRLTEVSAEQRRVAFEASTLSCGESCRDPVDRIAEIGGAPVADVDGRLLEAIGGPRGCTHLLALSRHVGATLVELALPAQRPAPSGWRAGERLFYRTVVYDAAERGDDAFAVHFQLMDIAYVPTVEIPLPLERFGRQTEVRGRAIVSSADLALRDLALSRRDRDRNEIGAAAWTDLGPRWGPLLGHPVARGWRRRVLASGGRAGEPVTAALLDLAGAVLQCIASCTEHWPAQAVASPSVVVSGGPPDSCYMWRADGVLGRALAGEQE